MVLEIGRVGDCQGLWGGSHHWERRPMKATYKDSEKTVSLTPFLSLFLELSSLLNEMSGKGAGGSARRIV